ncbi:MAG: copper chaperone PCu(A)C [Minwuia sp.]|nr:copper chaperone PCu(A)C [Minwuia sp.]
MITPRTTFLPFVLLLVAVLNPAAARETKVGDLTLIHPHAFATIGRAGTGAVFLTIRNSGVEDRLIGVESSDAVRAELHTHIHDNGRMMMREVEGITIPAKGEAALQPGGDHIMLMGLKGPLVVDHVHDLVLIFRDAGRAPVEFVIEKR